MIWVLRQSYYVTAKACVFAFVSRSHADFAGRFTDNPSRDVVGSVTLQTVFRLRQIMVAMVSLVSFPPPSENRCGAWSRRR